MQNTSTTNFNQSSVRLISAPNVNGHSWLNSSESQVPQSSLSNTVNLKVESPLKHSYKELQDQESSSTQSTGQSHLELPTTEGANPHNQFGMVNSQVKGSDEAYAKRGDAHLKSVLSRGAPDFIFPTSQVDYNQTLAQIPYTYPDPYYGGVLAPCGPQANIHPSVLAFARVPLPADPSEDEPIYVNPKQYRGILRRRESRAKLEAQNKLIKARKPYLHESRHAHAMKRVRGTGGRFLNTKKQEGSGKTNAHDTSEKSMLKLGEDHLDSKGFQYGNSNTSAAAVSRSETTYMSHDGEGAGDGGSLQMSNLKFSRHPAYMNGTMLGEGYIMCNGSQYRVPGIR